MVVKGAHDVTPPYSLFMPLIPLCMVSPCFSSSTCVCVAWSLCRDSHRKIWLGRSVWPTHLVAISCIDGLMQEKRNSIPNALELRLSSTNPSIWRIVSSLWSLCCVRKSVFGVGLWTANSVWCIKLSWIFPGAPLKVNGDPGNTQSNLTCVSSIFSALTHRDNLSSTWKLPYMRSWYWIRPQGSMCLQIIQNCTANQGSFLCIQVYSKCSANGRRLHIHT